MKLQEIMQQGFSICGWNIKSDPRGERRVVFKFSKQTSHGKKFYVAHTPQLDTVLKNVEFTEPVLLK